MIRRIAGIVSIGKANANTYKEKADVMRKAALLKTDE